MYLTRENINDIVKTLRQYTVRDTEFKQAKLPLSGEEQVALVLNDTNVRISAKRLLEFLFPLIEYNPGSCVYVGGTISEVFANNTCSYISGDFAYTDPTIIGSSPCVSINTSSHKSQASGTTFSNNFATGRIPAQNLIGFLYYGNSNATESAINLSLSYNKS